MECPTCHQFDRKNRWECPNCGTPLEGGVVFVTGISGSDTGQYLRQVVECAEEDGHEAILHDIGDMMREYAEDIDPNIQWDLILDADEKALKNLRTVAFLKLSHQVQLHPKKVHIVDLHLSFRWRACMLRGFEPHLLEQFRPFVRCFINYIQDLKKIKANLAKTTWGDRRYIDLLHWRDDELFLASLFADVCGRVDCYALGGGEPPSELNKLIWHPEYRKVYLSYPMTHIKEDREANREIQEFRDRIREFLVVFDPGSVKDYEDSFLIPEMKAIQEEIGEATGERDYRFIDQADAIVVYFPKEVTSKGVDAELAHAFRSGKPRYIRSPKAPREHGPFAIPPTEWRSDPEEFIKMLEEKMGPGS